MSTSTFRGRGLMYLFGKKYNCLSCNACQIKRDSLWCTICKPFSGYNRTKLTPLILPLSLSLSLHSLSPSLYLCICISLVFSLSIIFPHYLSLAGSFSHYPSLFLSLSLSQFLPYLSLILSSSFSQTLSFSFSLKFFFFLLLCLIVFLSFSGVIS